MTKKYPLGNYGLSIVLGVLFITALGAQTYFGWNKYVAEHQTHHEQPTVFGRSGYFQEWGEATMENWQSEFLQLLAFVVLTAFLVHKGSHESRDEDDETKQQLKRMEKQISEIKEALHSRPATRVI
jgi:hypothetical protein